MRVEKALPISWQSIDRDDFGVKRTKMNRTGSWTSIRFGINVPLESRTRPEDEAIGGELVLRKNIGWGQNKFQNFPKICGTIKRTQTFWRFCISNYNFSENFPGVLFNTTPPLPFPTCVSMAKTSKKYPLPYPPFPTEIPPPLGILPQIILRLGPVPYFISPPLCSIKKPRGHVPYFI